MWMKQKSADRQMNEAGERPLIEQEWLACADPRPMLEFLRGKASDRKLRLFAVACCRRIWHWMIDKRSRRAVELAEQFADGLVSLKHLNEAASAAVEATWTLQDAMDSPRPAKWTSEKLAAAMAAEMAAATETNGMVWGTSDGYGSWEEVQGLLQDEDSAMASDDQGSVGTILRDILDNPFRPAIFNPACLTPTVVSLATSIYEERAFDRMPILADALEDAGCDNADILNHCRQPGDHVRGCWAVDLLLGKQ
jgi:hypothetical protein